MYAHQQGFAAVLSKVAAFCLMPDALAAAAAAAVVLAHAAFAAAAHAQGMPVARIAEPLSFWGS
jgi:hypothetical protein